LGVGATVVVGRLFHIRLGQSTNLESLSNMEKRWKVLLGDADLTTIHKLNQSLELGVLHIL